MQGAHVLHITEDVPQIDEVHSFYVNHKLQDANQRMAEVARENALKFGALAHEGFVPWGTGVYPPKPNPGDAMEGIARQVRLRCLYDLMCDSGIDVVAFGHHADDQAETALMRWSHGSSPLGLAGMRPVRRWGMGDSSKQGSLSHFGAGGLHKRIVRPLLPVSKVRLPSYARAIPLS
jgi:tRNA(Ile)-lysidine synthase